MGKMAAEPYGAALMTMLFLIDWFPIRMTGCEGRNGARCALTATGPTPGKGTAVLV